MTYQNDPNRDFNRPIEPDLRFAEESRWGTGSVLIASLAALAVVFGLFYAMSNRSDTSIARSDTPAVTTSAATTGSGAANRTPDSTGTKAAIPGQVPAPASPPSTNR